MNQNQDIFTVLDVRIKAKSKLEIYRVLTPEGDIYLPPIKEWNYQFIRDIISGAKLVCFKNEYVLVHQRKGCYLHLSTMF